MTTTGLLFFSGIILSYGIGVWVGTKIKQPKVIIRESGNKKNLKKRMGLSRRRR